MNDITVYLLYRPPSAPADSITELTEMVKKAERRSVIIGDFNLPEMDWDKGTARGRTAGLLEAVEDSFMDQLMNFPTQVKGNTLDLILTNIPDMFDEVSEQGRLGKSDHVMIFSKISGGGTEEDLKSTPYWRRADWDTMRAVLREGAWLRQLRSLDARTAWAAVRNKVTELVEHHVPNRRLRNQNRPAWLSQEILRAIRRKKKALEAV